MVGRSVTDDFKDYARKRSRAYLIHVRSTYLTVKTVESEITELRADIDGIQGIDYSRDRVSSSADDSAMLALVERKESLIAEYEAEHEALIQLQADAHRALRNIAEPQRSVLSHRYILGQSWTDLADEIGYSAAYCKTDLQDKGLYELFPFIPHESLPDACCWD